MEIDGRIVADGVKPGDATFRAAGDLTVRRAASADATHADSDGGILDFWSGQGSLLVGARLSVEGGARGGGGDIYIDAAHDVTVNAPISADGGDFDAGFVTSDTGGDVTINANVTARSVVGAGSGGIIDFAGRNVTVAEGVKILANGHRGEFGGDGGDIGFGASNDVIIHRNVVLSVRGARPDGYGGFFDIEADGNVSLAGLVRASGATGAGLVLVGAEGQTILTKDSRILADGKESGGEIDIYGAYVEVDGKVSGSARRRDGYSARVTLGSDGDVRVGGSIQMNGTSDTFGSGPLRVAGCNVELADGARVRHRGHMGEVEFEGRELIHLSPRARASARGDDGVVRFVHRDGGPAPLLEGRVSPAPVIQPDASLTACAP